MILSGPELLAALLAGHAAPHAPCPQLPHGGEHRGRLWLHPLQGHLWGADAHRPASTAWQVSACSNLGWYLFFCFVFFFFFFFLRPTRRTPRGRPRWRVSRFSCRSSWRANRCRRRWPSSSTRGNGFVSDTTATNRGCRLTATVLTNSLSRVSDVELLEEPEKLVILLIISSGKI